MSESQPEPWLRGTLREIPPVQRAVVHALELAGEDLQRWCGCLSDEQINGHPSGLPPVEEISSLATTSCRQIALRCCASPS